MFIKSKNKIIILFSVILAVVAFYAFQPFTFSDDGSGEYSFGYTHEQNDDQNSNTSTVDNPQNDNSNSEEGDNVSENISSSATQSLQDNEVVAGQIAELQKEIDKLTKEIEESKNNNTNLSSNNNANTSNNNNTSSSEDMMKMMMLQQLMGMMNGLTGGGGGFGGGGLFGGGGFGGGGLGAGAGLHEFTPPDGLSFANDTNNLYEQGKWADINKKGVSVLCYNGAGWSPMRAIKKQDNDGNLSRIRGVAKNLDADLDWLIQSAIRNGTMPVVVTNGHGAPGSAWDTMVGGFDRFYTKLLRAMRRNGYSGPVGVIHMSCGSGDAIYNKYLRHLPNGSFIMTASQPNQSTTALPGGTAICYDIANTNAVKLMERELAKGRVGNPIIAIKRNNQIRVFNSAKIGKSTMFNKAWNGLSRGAQGAGAVAKSTN